MASKLKDEDLRLNIIVNGDQGRKEMIELADTISKTKHEVKELKQEQKLLKAAGKENSEQYKKNEADLKSLNQTLEASRTRLDKLTAGLKLNEKTSGELRKEAKQLKKLLADTVPESAQWHQYNDQLTAVKGRLSELGEGGKSTDTVLQNLTGRFSKYAGSIAAIGAGIGVAVGAAWPYIQMLGELDDKLSGVMKTTGLSRAAVGRLSEALKQIDTRSTQEELLDLATVAGKLGISAEKDVLGFVRAADQIGVALGDDLGGTEEAVNSLGKLVDIFKLKEQFGLEDSLLRTGSAINELGNAGTASEGYLVEFTQELAGIAPAANISLQNVLGMAAVMDELGQPVEASTTAIGQFIVGLSDVKKFAPLAGMSVSEFSELLKRDGNEALIAVLKNLKSTGQGVEGLARAMGLAGVEGARATTALSLLSNNIELLASRQAIANEQFGIGNSLTKEANVQNNNLAANIEKIQNRLMNWLKNSALADGLNQFVSYLISANNEAGNLSSSFEEQQKKVESLTGNINPLLTRYDQLKAKAILNKSEQQELKAVINEIGEALPTAITKWDQYGNALGVNTTKARALVEEQRALMQYLQKDAIEAQKADIERLEKNFDFLNKQVATGRRFVEGQGGGMWVKMQTQEAEEALERLKALGKELIGARMNLQNLTGASLKTPTKSAPVAKTAPVVDTSGLKTEGELKAAEKAKKRLEALQTEVDRFQSKAEKGEPGADPELVAIENKYRELLAKAVGHEAEKVKITEAYTTLRMQREQEIEQISDSKARQRAIDALAKAYEREDLVRKENFKKRLKEVDDSNASELEKQLAKISLQEEYEQQAFSAKQERLTTELLMIQAQTELGEMEVSEREALAQRQIALQNQIADNAIANQQRIADKTRQINDSRRVAEQELQIAIKSAYQEGFNFISGLFKENAAAARVFFVMEKIAAAAKVIIQLQQELAAIRTATALQIAWASSNPFTMGMVPAIKATGAAQALKAKINAGTSVATIAGQTIAGLQSGGSFIDVIRSQDGKRFRAKHDPKKRGYVSRPTVLTGESGNEFVANHDAVSNPTVRPILDMIDTAQRNGSISTLNLEKILFSAKSASRVPGRVNGGYIGNARPESSGSAFAETNSAVLSILEQNIAVMQRIEQRLQEPITAEVSLLGRRGFVEKQNELNNLQSNANL